MLKDLPRIIFIKDFVFNLINFVLQLQKRTQGEGFLLQVKRKFYTFMINNGDIDNSRL